jgi:cytoskeletal protein CcmA (bactofilin family)
MAQPTPFLITTSTTSVKIDVLKVPYTPVILNDIEYTGQTLTVYETTNSPSIVQTPIVLSTTQGDILVNIYTSNAISTLINQPLGFVTVQSQLPSTWNFLNSFPFRNQYVSAGVLNITASTINTSNLSSVTQIASTLNVQNLRVTNSFSQSDNLVIATNFIATGNISLRSTLNVWDTTRFSSGLSTIGYAAFYSSFYVKDNLFVSSSLVTASTVYVSSLYVTGSLSTSKIVMGSSLVGRTMNVLLNNPESVDVGGNVQVDGTTSVGRAAVNAEMNIGSRFTSKSAYFSRNLFLLSSFSIGGDMIVDTETTFPNVKTDGDVRGNNLFTVYGGSLVNGNTSANNINIQDTLYINQQLNAQQGQIKYARVNGNFMSESTSGRVPSFSTLGNYSAYDILASTTTVTGNTSTLSNLVVRNKLTVDGGDMRVKAYVSTIGSLAVSGIVSVSGDIHVERNIVFSGNATFNSSINILSTFFTNSNTPALSTTIARNLFIQGNAYVGGTAILSSYTLDPAVTTRNFYVSTFNAAYLGIVSSANISTLFASTVAAGGISNPRVMFDLSGTLSSVGLTTQFLSTGQTTVNENNAPNSYFYTLSSLGVSATSAANRVNVASPAYLLSSTTVQNLLSSFRTDAYIVSGTHVGDASQLTDVSYPARLSTGNIKVSSMTIENIYGSNLYASSGILYKQIEFYSTLQVGQLYIFGNTDSSFSNIQSNAIFTQNIPNTLFVNGLQSYFVSPLTKKAYINQPNPDSNSPYTLEVNRTTILRGVESPGFIITVRSLSCRTAIISSMNIPQEGTIYISSGAIGPSSGTFFIGQQESNINPYTNIIQSYESTLRFNETLFVNHNKKKVGILTDPTYTLDVNKEIYNDSLTTFGKVNIANVLQERQQVSTIWVGGGYDVSGSQSNVRYSYDGEIWESPTKLLNMTLMNSVAYNGSIWVAAGDATASNCMIQYSSNLSQWNTTTGDLFTPGYPVQKVAWNGSIWVAVGITPDVRTRTIAWSATGTSWTYATSGGFLNSGAVRGGGYDVAWNGSLWVAVGEGDRPEDNILISGDGRNWGTSGTGAQFAVCLVWAERLWIAACPVGGEVGFVIKVSLDGINWTSSYIFEDRFIEPNGIAYGNGVCVLVTTNFFSEYYPYNNTIFYSQDFGTTWTQGQGRLFLDTGRTVAWNGSYWIAGGNDGVRKSYDGITWFNPATAPEYSFFGMGYSSNIMPFMKLASPSTSFTSPATALNFYNSPLPGVLDQTSSSVVSVSRSNMSFNNSFFMDSNQNVTIPYAMTPYEQSLNKYTSSFVLISGVGHFSTFLSSPQVRVGGLYLGTQFV